MPYAKIFLDGQLVADGYRELDFQVASKVMNWSRLPNFGLTNWDDLESFWFAPSGDNQTVPYYSTDRNEAAKVLKEIERRGLIEPFMTTLNKRVLEDGVFKLNQFTLFNLISLPPEAICEAALEVVPDE